MTTDLWDWADVAAVGHTAAMTDMPRFAVFWILEGDMGLVRSNVAAAIRYGYEQAQRDAPQFGITPRPAVLWFAEQMETKLRANDHKGGWLGIGMEYAQRRMRQEALELETAIVEYSHYNADGSLKTDQQELAARHRIILEAADVANFAMMIADEWRPYPREREKDFGAATGTGRSRDSGEGHAIGVGKEPQGEPQQKSESTVAQHESPVAASEFPLGGE